MGMKVEYVKDRDETLRRLDELAWNVQAAERELALAVKLLRVADVPWSDIAEGLGFGSKGAAANWARRNPHYPDDLSAVDDSERAHLGRLLGLGKAQMRYQVRQIVAGKRGVSKLEFRVLCTTYDLDRANTLQRQHGGEAEGFELWEIEPSGHEERRTVAVRQRSGRGSA